MDGDLNNFRPPVLVGERVAWLGSGSGLPQGATVRWIGRVPEITTGWTVGIELDRAMPVGGIDGTWQKRKLFSCQPKHGLLVPIDKVLKETSILNTRHSIGESFYGEVSKPPKPREQELFRQLSLPQSVSSQEFLSRVLPPSASKPVSNDQLQVALNFKAAASQIQTSAARCQNTKESNTNDFKIDDNVSNQLDLFRKHLDALERLKNHEHKSKRHRHIGQNPESLYALAKPDRALETSLVFGLIGERREKPVEAPQRRHLDRKKSGNDAERSSKLKIQETDTNRTIYGNNEQDQSNNFQKEIKRSINDENGKVLLDTFNKHETRKVTLETQTEARIRKQSLEVPKKLNIKLYEATFTDLPDLNPESAIVLETTTADVCNIEEQIVSETCTNRASSSLVQILVPPNEILLESVKQPTPTIRKKKQRDSLPPVPCPRKKHEDQQSALSDDRTETEDEWFDTTSVLYEPTFVKEFRESDYEEGRCDDNMTEGRFRQIDEDDIDRPYPSNHRILSASASAPGGTRKGLFSFLRWFRKNKTSTDLDLNAFISNSAASSPVFTRSRIINAESVDTLYSIATVSSFAFVPPSQYQKERFSTLERRKKRRAPEPPIRRDSSLPNTLEYRVRGHHRRTASESGKDRQSGAFSHVQGKRRAPQPPQPPPRLYPTLSSVKEPSRSLTKKKRPAPLPPELAKSSEPADLSDTVPVPVESQINSLESNTVNGNIELVDDMGLQNGNDENIVCNDTLKLDRGVLKPNKMAANPPDVAKIVQLSPVSPRPWYKRKSLEKRKEKVSEDWMPEVGYARPGVSSDLSPMKFFFSRNDDKKKEEKRKSGLSILTNISELDREAAEICRKENAQKQLILAANDAKFYSDVAAFTQASEQQEPETPKRNSTRELISLFNAIGSVPRTAIGSSFLHRENLASTAADSDFKPLPVGVANKPDVKTASVVETKDFVYDDLRLNIRDEEEDLVDAGSKSQALYEARTRRPRSPSPAISTIAEMSEPSSSAATTLNQYDEPVWTCRRCTLENLNWKTRCDACTSSRPNHNPTRIKSERSEMDFEIDWDQELRKYFPSPPSQDSPKLEPPQLSAKLTLSKEGDVMIKTETKEQPRENDVDEIRKKRLAFFMKSLGGGVSSIRDAAAKQSLDEAEKLKLKGMLKEMKNSLPKLEAVINNGTGNSNASALKRLPDVAVHKNSHNDISAASPTVNNRDDGARYGAIRKIKADQSERAEAILVTTTTVYEDIIVPKKKSVVKGSDREKSPMIAVPVEHFSTVGLKNGEPYTSLKKARRVGDGPFELMRARDLANIIQSKTGTKFPAHVYANVAVPQDEVSEGSDVSRLATPAGVAEFRAAWDPSSTNTIAVNRLLRRLETAIAEGKHEQAATLARELAALKVPCSVTRQRPSPSPGPSTTTVEMYVEDKVSHQGPIPLQVQHSMTLSQLKSKVHTEFQIPVHVQRWILGKQLASDDGKTLLELGVVEDHCPIFLYLVAPEPEVLESATSNSSVKEGASALLEKKDKSPPRGKGWYFNYEEDRYSYCESDSDKSPEKEAQDAVKSAAASVIQRTVENAISKTSSIINGHLNREVDEAILQPAAQSKPFSPKHQRPPLRSSQSLPEKETVESRKEIEVEKIEPNESRITTEASTSKQGTAESADIENKEQMKDVNISASAAGRPRSRSIFDLIKPQSNDTLKKDLKVISVNAVKETIEKLARRGEEAQLKGWRCAMCTLLNAPTRPGCAACTAPRPIDYVAPPTRPVDEELRRLRRDQAMDLILPDPEPKPQENASGSQHYLQLVNLDSADLVSNTEEFECPVCMMTQATNQGVILRDCLHSFCKGCLAQTVEFNEEAEVKCPYRDANYSCECVLQQREIKALVSQVVFEQHLARSVSQAENRIGNAFHCKTPDCKGWCILDDNVNEFRCPVCRRINCLTCQAIHEGVNCRTYQDRLKTNSETDVEAKRTKSMLEEMVQRGDAMACPTCQVVLMKKWGCDWLRCSMCKTEICWVTRGPRWGPQGKGDTSAGCQCGVNGIKCHPKCNYCH